MEVLKVVALSVFYTTTILFAAEAMELFVDVQDLLIGMKGKLKYNVHD